MTPSKSGTARQGSAAFLGKTKPAPAPNRLSIQAESDGMRSGGGSAGGDWRRCTTKGRSAGAAAAVVVVAAMAAVAFEAIEVAMTRRKGQGSEVVLVAGAYGLGWTNVHAPARTGPSPDKEDGD